MKDILSLIKEKRLFFDGGMGSMLQKRGLKSGELPENWNLEHPDIIEDIHKQYLNAGANIITTNTFGVNSLKHENYEELIIAAIKCAKSAASLFDESFVAFDIGPLGKFLKPIGDLSFENAVEVFSKSVRVAYKEGVDLILIETMTDSYETKAAVLAAKENSNLPVFVTNVYDEYGKTLTGSSPESMIAMLEGLKVDAIGINCSLGPDKMIPIIKRIKDSSSLPIICNPNAGLPSIVDGKAHYSLTSDEFADYAVILAQNGANILGGCCGTEPEYIQKTVAKTRNIPLNQITNRKNCVISSYAQCIEVNKYPLIIGERINPTGKPKLKQALKEHNINYVLDQGLVQIDNGAHILDVNVGLPEIDEATMLADVVSALQSISDIPLQLDSNNPIALENAIRIYNGKPMINSVNGDPETMEKIFPLVNKYGGVVIALTLDQNGIPNTPEERVKIAERIVNKALEFGIEKHDIIFDPLAMTVATDPNNANITLETVKKLNNLGYKTSLGISNVSFGMPNRNEINVPFFANALLNGLSCAIINPNSSAMVSVHKSFIDYIDNKISLDQFHSIVNELQNPTINDAKTTDVNISDTSLKELIIKGLTEKALEKTKHLLIDHNPLEIIDSEIIPALNEVSEAFEKQTLYLPQLLKSAECSNRAFSLIKESMPVSDNNGNSVILATVKGDIHDIGKNIVKLLLESYGFKVYDLGKDVEPLVVLEAVKKYNCNFVALSALMTTTLPSMEMTISLLKNYNSNIKVMVGGAVLTEEYSKKIGADYYGMDAISAVRLTQKYYGK